MEAILAGADMTLANVVRELDVYTTTLDEPFTHWTRFPDRFGNSDDRFATPVLGITRLPAQLLVMLETTAVRLILRHPSRSGSCTAREKPL